MGVTVAKNLADTELYRKMYAFGYASLGKRETHSQKNLGPRIFSPLTIDPWQRALQLMMRSSKRNTLEMCLRVSLM